MNYIKGMNRNQLELKSLDDYIEEDNEVRAIDVIVDSMDIELLGIKDGQNKVSGRPCFDPRVMIKLYVYGYFNGYRSSRQLEKQAKFNLEVKWLIEGLVPKHTAIADFRKKNIQAFENIFNQIREICNNFSLIGKELVAIDGTKIRANASKTKYYTKNKLKIMQEITEEKINNYLKELENNDSNTEEIEAKIESLNLKKEDYKQLQKTLTETSGISTTDKDAKRMLTGNTKGTIIGYNVQSTVDDKNKLIVNYDVKNNPTDQGLLYEEAKKAKEILGIDKIDVLADKAYYKNDDIVKCEEEGISTYVPKQKVSSSKKICDTYVRDNFKYDIDKDMFICPEGEKLYNHTISKNAKKIKYHNYEACRSCINREKCTSSEKGRAIETHPKERLLREVKKRLAENSEKYKKRQMIVEHPFGTIKRTMKFDYFLLRGKKSVSGEIGLVFACYNLKRLINIIGVKGIVSRYLAIILTIFKDKSYIFICI